MIYYDYNMLLHPKILGPKTHSKERSSSQIIVCLGLRCSHGSKEIKLLVVKLRGWEESDCQSHSCSAFKLC